MDPSKINIIIPKLTFSYAGKDICQSVTVTGIKCEADRYCYDIKHDDGWNLKVAFLDFSNGAKDVRCIDSSADIPPQLKRLEHRLRMTVEAEDQRNRGNINGRFWSQLSQARPSNQGTIPLWSNLHLATEKQLDEGARLNVRKFLMESIRIEDFGTRGAVLGETNNKRNYFCALYKLDTLRAPIACYSITRILPLLTYF